MSRPSSKVVVEHDLTLLSVYIERTLRAPRHKTATSYYLLPVHGTGLDCDEASEAACCLAAIHGQRVVRVKPSIEQRGSLAVGAVDIDVSS